MIYQIVRLFVNALTVDDKHYLLNRDSLTQPIHMQFSQKQKKIEDFFLSFLKSTLNLKHISKKDDPQS